MARSEMEPRDYTVAAAINEMGTLRPPTTNSTAGDMYLYMKQLEAVFLKVWEAGKRDGYAEGLLQAACQGQESPS